LISIAINLVESSDVTGRSEFGLSEPPLLQTARLIGLDAYEWLNNVLEKIVSGAVKSHEIDTLLAWNWRAASNPASRLAA